MATSFACLSVCLGDGTVFRLSCSLLISVVCIPVLPRPKGIIPETLISQPSQLFTKNQDLFWLCNDSDHLTWWHPLHVTFVTFTVLCSQTEAQPALLPQSCSQVRIYCGSLQRSKPNLLVYWKIFFQTQIVFNNSSTSCSFLDFTATSIYREYFKSFCSICLIGNQSIGLYGRSQARIQQVTVQLASWRTWYVKIKRCGTQKSSCFLNFKMFSSLT